MEENVVLEQETEQTEKKAKYVKPALAWGLIVAELVIVAAISWIVLA